MCGIAGVWSQPGAPVAEIAGRMAAAITHRGPDDGAVWSDAAAGLAFGHRRLSIIDLSPAGRQPMVSADRRYTICFNGEIYNFPELRAELERSGTRFRGTSDTEVLLEGIAKWGIEAALQRAAGMFALAVWDSRDRRLFLARDRMGEKPLYYGWIGGAFYFSSELKALRAVCSRELKISRDATALFMRYCYIPAPWSIYEGVKKLLPGTVLELRSLTEQAEPSPYWSLVDVAARGAAAPFTGDQYTAEEELLYRLRTAVAGQMISDVPLGAFLSGGIDSSLVVALMQEAAKAPVKTFSIGFAEAAYNEAPFAGAVARHLGTEHTELIVTASEAQQVIPKLPQIYDEPFGDSSQIPTYLVSRLARSTVTVALSGDAGDELFGGYRRYLWAERLWRSMRYLPLSLRRTAVQFLNCLPGRLPHQVQRLGEFYQSAGVDELYRQLCSYWGDPEQLVLGSREPSIPADQAVVESAFSGIRRFMFLDSLTYLPDDILVKVDRAAMAVSLETRVPFLDHRIAEFVWTLPTSQLSRQGVGKVIIRSLLRRYVPERLFERPKMGFGVPVGEWLRGDLREWAEDLLNTERLSRRGYLVPELVRARWDEHRSGVRDRSYQLWNVLMFEGWLEEVGVN